ncbi:hypothetical protein CQ009_05150 [Pseudomonas sp. MYb2]|uniref:hypothetical protein n=1 Tax=unclassified Pseudomonas TaxID=196821 RepID=UPI000D00C86A|nr:MULTISPECIES: hypothetical protein [unclassified Pseudomonas]PRB46424.1 hypothetical protein CQ025_19960 [Pseudomonas sp. MYb3]PRC35907.1 hypothetical protein CQ009_05150 [Pseudomonas sp. MYb2]
MNIVERIAAIDKKFAWSFLGFILAILFGGLTLYNEFIKVRDPQLTVEVLSSANVLDLKENVPELNILYGDVNIKSVAKDLSVITIKVKNIGGVSVLGNNYDSISPFVIILSAGELLKIETIGASNNYLEQFALGTKASESSILMPKVMIEPGESYNLKLLVIHDARSTPKISTGGKVGGMLTIPVTSTELEGQTNSFFAKAFSGSPTIQATRSLIYFFFFIALILAIALPIAGLLSIVEKARRKRNVRLFKVYNGNKTPQECEIFFDCYIVNGISSLRMISSTLINPGELDTALMAGKLNVNLPLEKFSHSIEVYLMLNKQSILVTQVVTHSKMVWRDESGAVVIDPKKQKLLSEFIEYEKIKNS